MVRIYIQVYGGGGQSTPRPSSWDGYLQVDNITDWCLKQFQDHYNDTSIAKDDIWHYLYGLLHAPDYRARYKPDLSKDLPHIPFASDFNAFQDAGAELAALHLGYEVCPEYKLQVDVDGVGNSVYHLNNKAMQWGGTRKEPDRSVLHVTSAVTLRGIPEAGPRLCGQRAYSVGMGSGPVAYPPGQGKRHRQRSQCLVRGQPSRVGVASAALSACERGNCAPCGGVTCSISGLKIYARVKDTRQCIL